MFLIKQPVLINIIINTVYLTIIMCNFSHQQQTVANNHNKSHVIALMQRFLNDHEIPMQITAFLCWNNSNLTSDHYIFHNNFWCTKSIFQRKSSYCRKSYTMISSELNWLKLKTIIRLSDILIIQKNFNSSS